MKEFERWGKVLRDLGAGSQGGVYLVRHPDQGGELLRLASQIASAAREVASGRHPDNVNSVEGLTTALRLASAPEWSAPGTTFA